jgi:putative membrane protein
VVGGLSLVPTLEFLTWGKSLKANTLPRVSPERIGRLRAVIMLELAGVIGMIACAALMARGHGMPG